MLRSLFSGVSGMKNEQTKMDVIANNIANVSTTAFKSGRVRFQDIFSQTIKDASAPVTGGLGGINPRQIGLGMQVAGIDTITNQGAPQTTGRPLDCEISGEGYFILSDGTSQEYTRDGAFNLDAGTTDADGITTSNIVSSDGLKLQGYANTATDGTVTYGTTLSDITIPDGYFDGTNVIRLNNYSIENDGTVKGVFEDGTTRVFGKIALAKFSNPAGLLKLGNNNFGVSGNSGSPVIPAATDIHTGTGDIIQGALEMSNVDLASEFTDMIITSRAFQANSKSITTSDEMLQDLINLKR